MLFLPLTPQYVCISAVPASSSASLHPSLFFFFLVLSSSSSSSILSLPLNIIFIIFIIFIRLVLNQANEPTNLSNPEPHTMHRSSRAWTI